MILLNFSHPITDAQRAQIEDLTGATIERTLAVMPQFDEQAPFVPQLHHLLEQVDLTPKAWQSAPILGVLPSLNSIAAEAMNSPRAGAPWPPTNSLPPPWDGVSWR